VVKLDARVLLRHARKSAGLGQGELAVRAGVARQTVNTYEARRRSPTVDQLNHLLAACGMEARVDLIALGPELEARIDAALAAVPALDEAEVVKAGDSFDELGVTWAVDGSSALALQGLAMGEGLAFVLVLDDACRRYVYRRHVKTLDRWNQYTRVPTGAPLEQMQAAFAHTPALVWGLGFLQLRVVDALPAVMPRIALADGRLVNVLAVSNVLEAHPEWAEVVRGALDKRAADGG
jgi:transcriptional regulator with XRE-family HTH domain